jgi:hypothetical protein
VTRILVWISLVGPALIAGSAPSLAQNPAATPLPVSVNVQIGLFRWAQLDNGRMSASFFLSNNTGRDIKELEITCSYDVMTGQRKDRRQVRAILRGQKLASQMSGPEIFRAGAGRDYSADFGQLEPVQWVSGMNCRPTRAEYNG